MRAGDSARCADLPDCVTACHEGTFTHARGREVSEQRKDSEAVIDDDGIAGEVEVTSEHHAPAVRCKNGCPCRTQEVCAAVWLARFAVEDAPRPERAVGPPWNGSHEALDPQPVWYRVRPHMLEFGSFARDAGEQRSWRIHERVINLEPPGGKDLPPHHDCRRRRDRSSRKAAVE